MGLVGLKCLALDPAEKIRGCGLKCWKRGCKDRHPVLGLILFAWPQTFETLNFYFPLFILYYLDKLYSIHP